MKLFSSRTQEIDRPRRRNILPADSSQLRSEQRNQFRRGRTLTGSSSRNIASSNELNSDMLSPRAMAHHLTAHRRRLTIRLTAAIVACLAIYVIIGQIAASLQVTTKDQIVLSSDQQQAYLKSTENYFQMRPVERFHPSLNTVSLIAYLQESHPEVVSADIVLGGGFGEANLILSLRQPIARWNIDGQDEYVDKNGVVFKTNYYAAPSLQIVDESGITPDAGKSVASARFLGFVGLVVGDLEGRGLKVTKATIPALKTRQIDINIEGVPYIFKLSTDRLAGEQTEDVSRIIAFLQKQGITPEYVDVRVKGKAFYK
jgi:hypothetical protein